jgi:dephospho-CoA kinase
VQRVMARSGWSEDQVRRVIAQQTPRPARRALADAVVCNDGLDMAALRHEVQALWTQWRALPQGPVPAV